MHVLPSKFQRRVGNLRLSARKEGLYTSAIVLPDLNAAATDKVSVSGRRRDTGKLHTVYELPFTEEAECAPIWQLVRYSRSAKPIDGWVLKDQRLQNVDLTDERYWANIAATINELPETCRSLEVGTRGVRWIGEESKASVESGNFLVQMKDALHNLQALSLAIHKRNSNDALETE